MKVAIASSGRDLSAPLDPRFGRAAGFLIVDTATGKTTYEPNRQNLNAPQGAGIQAAQNIASSGVGAVISGHFGPKAFRVLTAAKIKAYLTTAATAQEALDLFIQGKLTAAQEANVEGHWL